MTYYSSALKCFLCMRINMYNNMYVRRKKVVKSDQIISRVRKGLRVVYSNCMLWTYVYIHIFFWFIIKSRANHTIRYLCDINYDSQHDSVKIRVCSIVFYKITTYTFARVQMYLLENTISENKYFKYLFQESSTYL